MWPLSLLRPRPEHRTTIINCNDIITTIIIITIIVSNSDGNSSSSVWPLSLHRPRPSTNDIITIVMIIQTTSTINLFGCETPKLTIRRLKLNYA